MEWWKWLMASAHDLRALRLDPADRVKHCGHRFAITPHWARTVGMWGGTATARTIMDRAGVERAAYENFKHRNRLKTCGRKAPETQDVVSLTAYLVVNAKLIGNATVGEAAAAAAKNWKTHPESHSGMLPVELMLRWTDMAMVLELTGLDPNRFYSMKPETQEAMYAAHSQMRIAVPDEAFDVMG